MAAFVVASLPASASADPGDGADDRGGPVASAEDSDDDQKESESDGAGDPNGGSAPGDGTDDSDDGAPSKDAASDGNSPQDGRAGSAASTGTPPESPDDRLERAETAFRNGEFKQLPPLLEPALEPTPAFETVDKQIRARELLAVGYFFEAQQATNADRRDELIESARNQFLALLRERPDYELDEFVFPASVVEVFDEVREAHADELERLREQRSDEKAAESGSNTLYIEREVVRYNPALNLLPFGIGQFQNGQPTKGYAIAGLQAVALALQTTGFVAIWTLRNPRTGLIPIESFPAARAWRIAQIGAGATFGATYAISVADGFANFEPRDVHIRTRDSPPPELDDGASSGLRPLFRIGLGGVSITW